MHTLQTGEHFETEHYTVTRIGAGAGDAKNQWALLCVAFDTCNTCDSGKCELADGGGQCNCAKQHVHLWVKEGHSFSAGCDAYLLESTNREASTVIDAPGNVAGLGDC